MKTKFILLAVAAITLTSDLVRADAFDEKANAASARRERAKELSSENAEAKRVANNNAWMVRRVLQYGSLTSCRSYNAAYSFCENDMVTIQLNGIPVQICAMDSNQALHEIVSCRYHVQSTGQDCEIVRNPKRKPRCY